MARPPADDIYPLGGRHAQHRQALDVGGDVTSIDSVTLSNGESEGNARRAAVLHGFTDRVGSGADDADREICVATARVTDAGSC